MTFFKKINRGLILLLVLVLASAGYLTALHFMRRTDKSDITSLTREYMQVFESGLPLGNRTPEAAKDDIKKDQLSFFANENAAEPTLTAIGEQIDAQKQFGTITDFSVTVTKITGFMFDGNTATAEVAMQITYEGPEEIISTSQKTFQTTSKLVYQKTDGKWKLFYFDTFLYPSTSMIFD